jgi:hypothetical protein
MADAVDNGDGLQWGVCAHIREQAGSGQEGQNAVRDLGDGAADAVDDGNGLRKKQRRDEISGQVDILMWSEQPQRWQQRPLAHSRGGQNA